MNIFKTKIIKKLKRRLSVSPNETNHHNNDTDRESMEQDDELSLTQSFQQQLNITTITNYNNNNNNNNNENHSHNLPLFSNQNMNETEDDDTDLHQEESPETEEKVSHDTILPLDHSDQSEMDLSDDDTSNHIPPHPTLFNHTSIEQKEMEQQQYINHTQQQQHQHKPSINLQYYNDVGLHSEFVSVETSTIPKIYKISWFIDERSLKLLKNRNRSNINTSSQSANHDDNNSGVLEADVVKNGISFKLELCIAGWKNSNRGYCAFYLTIPQNAGSSTDRLVARYTVCIGDINHSKTSSIRSDFHLGVGFPNFCTEHLLLESLEKGANQQQLVLNVNVEIFKMTSKTKSIETVIYQQFTNKFGIDIERKSNVNGKNSKGEKVESSLLRKMYKNNVCSDVQIRCKTMDGIHKSISVHKCVLTHSSIVFSKMFETKTSVDGYGFIESQQNEVNLEDSWRFKIVEGMVEFLYFGRISDEICNDITWLFELFRIAEYFEVNTLITECCHQFILSLSPNNVCYLLLKLVSNDNEYEFEYKHIKEIQFIHKNNILWRYMVKNIKEIQKTTNYRQILYKRPMILDQLIAKMT